MLNRDLTGLEPIDWPEVYKKYPGIKNYEIKDKPILERDEVMRSLIHRPGNVAEDNVQDLEDVCKTLTDDKGAVARELRVLAKQYIVFKNKEARLPKFGKWVNSMFSSRPEYNAMLAQLGQAANAQGGKITISCHPADILRGGLGKHFMTCLGPAGNGYGYANVLPAVLHECAGVAIAYIESDDPNGAYKARAWLNHIRVKGEDAIQMNRVYGNGFTNEQLAELIASKGYDVYTNSDWNNKNVKFEWVNNFKRRIHWDAIEYGDQGTLVKKATAPRPVFKAPARRKKAA